MMRVLITREVAEPLWTLFSEAGAEPVHAPLIELSSTGVRPPPVEPDAVLVTSAAVVRFVPNLAHFVGDARVVAVGSRTRDALVASGVQVAQVGVEGGLSAASLLALKPGETAWYVGAEKPSVELESVFEKDGWVRWHVYRTVPVASEQLRSIECHDFDIVTFASGSAVRAFVARYGKASVPVAVIGASTAEVAKSLGVDVSVVARAPTLKSLADAVKELMVSIAGR